MKSAVLLVSALTVCVQGAPVITTIAGTGAAGHSGDGGPAAAAGLNQPFGITRGPDGALYVCEFEGHAVRRIDDRGIITTVAGTGIAGYAGDGGPAVQARLNRPHEIRFGPDGALYIADMATHTIRRVDMKSGIISTFAGSGRPGFLGDGGPAAAAEMKDPISLQFDSGGSLYICDIGNNRIRVVDAKTGIIRTACGNGAKEPVPPGALFGPETPLQGPRTIDFDASGRAWIALREGHAVYRADLKTGSLTRIAGTGKPGFSGNGGPAGQAQLSGPKGLSVAPDGRVFIADTENHSIRVITPRDGLIDAVAGDGRKGPPVSGPAGTAQFARPHGVFMDRDGTLYVGDSENHVVRAVRGLP